MADEQQQLITEDEFRPLLDERTAWLRRSVSGLLKLKPTEWTRKSVAQLREHAHDAETYLDDFDARNNSRYTFLTELIASIRGFTNILITARHIEQRLGRYGVSFSEETKEKFVAELSKTSEFSGKSLTVLLTGFLEEAHQIGLEEPELKESTTTERDSERRHLPHDLDEGEVMNEHQVVAQIVGRFRQAREQFGSLAIDEEIAKEKLSSLSLRGLDESHARELGALFHGIQARYDTFVNRTSLESTHPNLVKLRGHISLTFHLIELATDLIHFYERHENDIRWEPAKARIAQLVDKTAVLDRAVNFALRYATLTVDEGLPVADEVLPSFVPLDTLVLPIPEGIILHARPLSLLVKIANHHGTSLEMKLSGNSCDASSIMNMIMLAGSHTSAREVEFSGDVSALNDVKLLFEAGLGESGLDSLPTELDYLK